MKYRILVKYIGQEEQIMALSKTLELARFSFTNFVSEAKRNRTISSVKLMDDDGFLYAQWEA